MGRSEQMDKHEELWAYLLTREGELGDFAPFARSKAQHIATSFESIPSMHSW
jgi:hypothetical protein